MLWEVFEVKIGIIVANLASMRQLFKILQANFHTYMSRKGLIELSSRVALPSRASDENQESQNDNKITSVHICTVEDKLYPSEEQDLDISLSA